MKVYVDITVRYTRECQPGGEAEAQAKLQESTNYMRAQAEIRPMVGDNLRIDVLNVTDATILPE